MKNKTIVVLGHNDLDQLGCVLHINYRLPDNKKKYFYTNYRDLEQKVSEAYAYCFLERPSLLLITDISFSNHKHLLKKLEDVKQICPVVLLDHHAYQDGFFDDISISVYHDIEKSATKICEEYFRTNNANLNKISKLINAYDIWLMKSPIFRVSMNLNNFFYKKTENISIDQYAEQIRKDNYTLPGFKEFLIEDTKLSNTKIENFKKRKLITHIGPKFTVAFVDEYFNEILFEEFSKDAEFVMIANSYGITRFRFNAFGNLTTKQKEEIKIKLIGTLDIGHLNAFSDKIIDSNFDKIMAKVEEGYNIVKPYIY